MSISSFVGIQPSRKTCVVTQIFKKKFSQRPSLTCVLHNEWKFKWLLGWSTRSHAVAIFLKFYHDFHSFESRLAISFHLNMEFKQTPIHTSETVYLNIYLIRCVLEILRITQPHI